MIIALRQPDAPLEGRYLSKNNANIARIDALATRALACYEPLRARCLLATC
ncbi:MAG TPA: hypothetical protein VMQ83_00560 [Gammaproteobacteria bacterium]|nr:hypothetical protein [Gammaproteobacteria bacterium]